MAEIVSPFSPLMMLVGLAILLAVRLVYGESRLDGGDEVHLAMRVTGWVLVAMGALALLELLLGVVFGVLFWIVLIIALGSMVARYRQSERAALVWVLAIAAERQMPLPPAIEAFAHEWGGSFGRRSLRLARALRSGVQLPDALVQLHGLAPHSARVAAYVGTEAGCLGPALREAAALRQGQAPVWQSIVSKSYYLLLVLLMAQVVTLFMSIRLAPAMQMILEDFGIEPPAVSVFVLSFLQDSPLAQWLILGILIQIALLLYLLLHTLGWLPWGVPLLDRVTKALDSGLVLRGLAWMVQRGKPLHAAISATARCYPKFWFRRRLARAVMEMSNGQSWHEALAAQGIVSAGDSQLLVLAQRAGNLPWVLRLVAENGERRLTYKLQWLVQTLYPLAIAAISLLVALYVLAFFMPLVRIIEGLVQ